MPNKIILSSEQQAFIVNEYYSGATLKDLAKKFNVSEPTMRSFLKSLDLKRMGRISDKDIDIVLENSSYHLSKIIDITGLDRVTVLKILNSKGITPGKRYKKPEQKEKSKSRYEIFKDLYTPDVVSELLSKSVNHACSVTGFSEVIIKRFAKEFGIEYKHAFVTINHVDNISKQKIIDMYVDNIYTVLEIQQMFNIGSKTFRKIVKNISRNQVSKNPEFEEYKKIVRRLTTVVKNLFNIKPGEGQHVDHKISVYDGFNAGIPAYLIASNENLEIISAEENLKKGSSSSITKDELYKLLNIS